MVRKILLNHLLRHLACGDTEIAPCPKMLPPVPLLHLRKLFEYFPRCSSFHPSHNVGWRNIRGRRHKDMDVIFADHPSQDLDLVTLTSLADKFPHSDRKISHQHGIAVLGHPDEVVFDLVFCVATLAIFHGCQYKSAASRMLPA